MDNATPVGNAPVSVNVGVGNPVAVSVKDPAVPAVKIVLAALLKRCRFTLLNTQQPGVARTRFLMGPKEPIVCRYDGPL